MTATPQGSRWTTVAGGRLGSRRRQAHDLGYGPDETRARRGGARLSGHKFCGHIAAKHARLEERPAPCRPLQKEQSGATGAAEQWVIGPVRLLPRVARLARDAHEAGQRIEHRQAVREFVMSPRCCGEAKEAGRNYCATLCGRSIPRGCVARRLRTTSPRPPRALPRGRLDRQPGTLISASLLNETRVPSVRAWTYTPAAEPRSAVIACSRPRKGA